MNRSPLSYIVFTDFDGTVSRTDIGDALFQYFGDARASMEYFRAYRNGTMDAQECWKKTCATVPSLTPAMLMQFLEQHRLDPTFRPFVKFCDARSIPVIIVSDGFGVYIDAMLERENLGLVPRLCNTLAFKSDGSIEPQFPYTDAECDRCANCKRNHVLTMAGDDQVIVYIGDGHSDCCPARFADIVFAKGTLLRFCEKENITYHRFERFGDIQTEMEKLLQKKIPRKRHAAEHARKEIFAQG